MTHIIRYLESGNEVGARPGIGVACDDGTVRQLPVSSLAELLAGSLEEIRAVLDSATSAAALPESRVRRLAPVDGLTEVWASGVTYRRSRQARIAESGDGDVYARVYDAVRPELFFKSVAWRAVSDGDPIGVRADSAANTPEPELALVFNAAGQIVGVTVCNDVSSRSIEGENPLYLPQAKIYTASCALGPGIRPVWEVADLGDLAISCTISRGDAVVWSASTSTALLHRRFDDLAEHLFRAMDFPHGVILSTGTGIVPELDLSLTAGDIVRIEIEHVGVLTNPVIQVPV
ncbi:fumarylacetoacetate (FAA) hydrolase [Rhizocola hellebori]|uniref:Fumarylacetoacetate (FAA) hydrolase n=1 Tax=Rhizocola hellebori TaxID=1392758 RepID=A0A8J3Q4Z9_9ACTN|nr:fumarylacetoacetate hydrolase family protein [Rhizocola hellebori]GIH03557.1 fumarylacetoacetate (FAA) hydrolase [Rhizocola hellebori]